MCQVSCIYAVHMSPALNRTSALQLFKHSNAIEICNRIMLNFCLGLPHLTIKVVGDGWEVGGGYVLGQGV